MRSVANILLLSAILAQGCVVHGPEKYVPATERGREKYATPEPGTYIKPAAHAIVQQINKVLEDSGSFEEPAGWIMDLLSTAQKATIDTVVDMEDHKVPVRIYYPTRISMEGNHPLVLFFHGGGFIFGDIDTYHLMVSKLASVTNHIVVSVDYRLAPEFPFPAALQDCFAALMWVRQNAVSLGADPERISVMGDSAGGNIATVLTLRCRDDQLPQPYRQVLIYPGVTFVDTLYPSLNYFAQSSEMDYVLSEEFMLKVKRQYMGDMNNERHPYLSPLEADLTAGLAPALIITAECDPIRDGGRAYAEKLSGAGVPVRHIEFSGMIHGFMNFHMFLSDAVVAMKQIRDFLWTKKPLKSEE